MYRSASEALVAHISFVSHLIFLPARDATLPEGLAGIT
jgi:hypothetical protein